MEITGPSLFPLEFFVHRWVENVPVVQRAIEITPLMNTPKNNRLCSTVTSFLEDKLLNACKDVFPLGNGKTVSHILETLSTNGSISGKGS